MTHIPLYTFFFFLLPPDEAVDKEPGPPETPDPDATLDELNGKLEAM